MVGTLLEPPRHAHLRTNVLHHPPEYIGQAHVPPSEAVGQALVVNAK